ncbi:MAG: carbon-nitrogen hydrolase family protein [Oscillospiraceae bacterium]|nr:carbon-nitrogen hydrolase family protein [Oscillospiraceae bacterium]
MVKAAAFSRIKYGTEVPREDYIQLCENAAYQAGKAGCDLFVLPEHFDTFGSLEMAVNDGGIYCEGTDRSDICAACAEPVPGPMTHRFGCIAQDFSMYIAANYYERDDGKTYNTCVLIDRKGNVAGKYRKSHLCGSEHRINGVTAGDELPVFDCDFGKIGIIICMDMNYPEIARILTLKGANILLWPHQTYGPTEEMVLLQARARAIDNACYIVGADFASLPPFAPYCTGHEYMGRATIINPDGVIIADTGHLPGLAIAAFEPEQHRITKDVVCIRKSGVDYFGEDILRTRRPELYGEITRRTELPKDEEVYDEL